MCNPLSELHLSARCEPCDTGVTSLSSAGVMSRFQQESLKGPVCNNEGYYCLIK